MTTPDRRRAERVEVGIPAQLYTRRGFVSAEVRDLSRTGLRLRASTESLGFPPTDKLTVAARGLAAALGPTFAIDLDYEKYGPLLQCIAVVTRIGLPPDAPDCVELCCEFQQSLGEDEAGLIGASLPDLKDTVDTWGEAAPEGVACRGVVTMRPPRDPSEPPVRLPAAPEKTFTPRPRQRYRALMQGSKPKAPPALFCHTDLVTAIGVRVSLPRRSAGGGASSLFQRLVKEHGRMVELRLLGDGGELWSGPARISGVELPTSDPSRVLVTLAYATPLSMADLRRLGLLERVA